MRPVRDDGLGVGNLPRQADTLQVRVQTFLGELIAA